MRSFSYQPAETGLLFVNKVKANGRNIKKGQEANHIINLVFEKKSDGTDSDVVRVNNLSEFLALCVNKIKPVFVRIFSDEKQYKEIFQQVANKFKDKAFFVSLDSFKNLSLIQVFLVVLKAKGINLPDGVDSYPMFLFCDKDFVLLQNNSVAFQKDALKLLAVRYVEGAETLSRMVQKAFSLQGQKSNVWAQNEIQNASKTETKSEKSVKSDKNANFWKKLKNWFK